MMLPPSVLNSTVIVASTVVALIIVFHPRVVNSMTWRATVTPLASIIGSGFLVLGPILKHGFGVWGIVVMLLLCIAAYLLGAAIRFNIARYDFYRLRDETVPQAVSRLEKFASYALVVAYVISIAYYLNLFGAFAVSLTPFNSPAYARIVTTAALAFVAVFGWLRGFSALERIEEGTVGLKLSIIAGLLVGLIAFSIERACGDGLYFSQTSLFDWQSVAVALGLVITVQGFETSRYLGSEFDAETRIRTMRVAQWTSAAIYLLYIGLTTFCFSNDEISNSETAIIGMTQLVAPVLPAMLVAAALAAQFSAAVADTGGCGGLAEEVTQKRIRARVAYLLIGVLGISLTWVANIYSIIAYASRAFAVYYALQCVIAAMFAAKSSDSGRVRVASYLTLALFAVAIVVFGKTAE